MLAVGGLALAAPGVAGAAVPACGTNLTHSVTLTGDMTCTTSDGLDVGKSGITINLNGHTITGPSGSYDGVYDSGYGHVTIENGRIRNFYNGVYVDASDTTKISNIKVHGAANAGVYFAYSQDGVIDHLGAFANTSYGAYLYENSNLRMTSSKTNQNHDYGIYDYYSAATLNHVTSSNNSNYGFYIDYPAAYTSSGPYTLENSTADHNGYAGFLIYDNLPQWQYQAALIGNTANDNSDYGFYAEYWAKGSHNHATGNGTRNCYRVRGCS